MVERLTLIKPPERAMVVLEAKWPGLTELEGLMRDLPDLTRLHNAVPSEDNDVISCDAERKALILTHLVSPPQLAQRPISCKGGCTADQLRLQVALRHRRLPPPPGPCHGPGGGEVCH